MYGCNLKIIQHIFQYNIIHKNLLIYKYMVLDIIKHIFMDHYINKYNVTYLTCYNLLNIKLVEIQQ